MSSREQHREAVFAAHSKARELQEVLMLASERADELRDLLAPAVGDDPQIVPARAVYVLTDVIRENLGPLIRQCPTIQLHLNDYLDTV
jgi:hypothetical protein